MNRKKIQTIIIVAFLIYGVVALLVSFPFSPFLNTSIPLRFIFPQNYRMFVRPSKVYTTLELVYFDEGKKDSVKIPYSEDLQQQLKEEFPFNANSYYYYSTLLFSSHKLDYFNNVNQYMKKHPDVELDNRKLRVYQEAKKRRFYYEKGLYRLSEKIQRENPTLKRFKNVVIRLKAHNILPKYDTAYYEKNEYVYSLPNVRTIIELKK